MSETLPLAIHIGYPKTATSYLQTKIFPWLDKQGLINYVPFGKIKRAIRRIQYQDELHFDPIAIRAEVSTHLQEGRMNVISYEALTGEMFYKCVNAKAIANKLHVMFPEAKILIVVRNQVKLIYSLYKQYVQEGGCLPLPDFMNLKKGKFIDNYEALDNHVINMRHLKYDILVNYYRELFGAVRVQVLPYELLRDNGAAFLKDLLMCVGAPESNIVLPKRLLQHRVNQGFGRAQIALARFFNRFFYSNFNRYGYLIYPGRIPFASTRIDVRLLRKVLQGGVLRRLLGNRRIGDMDLDRMISEYYSESNQTLMQTLPPSYRESFNRDLKG